MAKRTQCGYARPMRLESGSHALTQHALAAFGIKNNKNNVPHGHLLLLISVKVFLLVE
jgi:hypothetical protein